MTRKVTISSFDTPPVHKVLADDENNLPAIDWDEVPSFNLQLLEGCRWTQKIPVDRGNATTVISFTIKDNNYTSLIDAMKASKDLRNNTPTIGEIEIDMSDEVGRSIRTLSNCSIEITKNILRGIEIEIGYKITGGLTI